MAHVSHKLNAYRNGNGWVEYCQVCSAETIVDLDKKCPGKYVRKSIRQSQDEKAIIQYSIDWDAFVDVDKPVDKSLDNSHETKLVTSTENKKEMDNG